MRDLFPAIEPFFTGFLDVGHGHQIYYEESGNQKGQPAIFVHGGPGGGTQPDYRRFFDPAHYRIILFDQRGCGKSTPNASLDNNTTWDLVRDMESIREKLSIEKWLVFGGSWGSTLALAYAETHPNRCTHLVLRGIFLLRRWEIDWFYQKGADAIFPDAWEEYLKPIPIAERGDLLSAYHKRLTSSDKEVQLEVARAWSIWEGSTSKLYVDPNLVDHYGSAEFALAFARIECHYFMNHGFVEEGQLLREVGRIRHIPTMIVQGRYDVVCPMRSAWDLHRAFPEARLHISPTSGHSVMEPENRAAVIAATEEFKVFGN